MPSGPEKTKAKAGAMIVPVTLFEQNCTILWNEATKKAVVIDPGGDVPKIREAIAKAGVTVEKIWLTHGHIDHVGGAAELRDALGVPIEGPHIADNFLLDNVVASGARFGITGRAQFHAGSLARRGRPGRDRRAHLRHPHCPGHSPGSVVFFNKEMRFAHVGDVLFNGSVGRTDLPGGSHATLIRSIKDKLLPLGDDVGFICGHGAGSSFGQERMTNRFSDRGGLSLAISSRPPAAPGRSGRRCRSFAAASVPMAAATQRWLPASERPRAACRLASCREP